MYCNNVFKFNFKCAILLFSVFLVFSANSYAKNQAIDSVKVSTDTVVSEAPHAATTSHHEEAHEKEFDPTEVILEHISDSHVWHLWGHTSISLPVILYTPKGIDVFSSGNFHHGEHDYNSGLYTYRLVHEKIKVVGANAQIDEVLSAKVLDFSITKNVAAMFVAVLVILAIFISVASAYKKRAGKSPKGLQSFVEPIIVFVRDDIARPNIGYKYAKFMPYLLTVFFFIWINNMLGLIPIFPGGANVTGNIALTFVLAMGTLLVVNLNGNKYYWKHLFLPDVPFWLWPLMVVVELIGVISKPFALMVRLFANITAGHIIVLSLISLIFIFKTLAIAPVSIAFVLFMDMLELLVAFLQAFIFTLLTALFIGMAVEEHH
ncbi:MAG: F0F1 ATP synthase subunit A [Sphingobacteriaceae bacterium]|nr:F0F1 ATP synthase subunit A [Sphingobacteriaceae bacterium]